MFTKNREFIVGTAGANNVAEVKIDISESGYTPIMATPYASNNMDWIVYTRCQIINNELTVRVKNLHTSTSITVNAFVKILYVKK